MTERRHDDDVLRRLEAVERALGLAPAPVARQEDSAVLWLVQTLAGRTGPAFDRDGIAGSVAFGGQVRTPAGTASWQMEHPAPDVLEQDWAGAATVLSALAHPVRLQIVRHLLLGARTLADLQEIPGLGTSGQLAHHLRELRSAGVVTSPRRNDYAVPARWVVPCLVIVAAAGPGAAPDAG